VQHVSTARAIKAIRTAKREGLHVTCEIAPHHFALTEEAVDDYFVDGVPDPFMLQVYPVRPDKRALVPAITHVDGSGRLQTVSPRSNPRYYRLIKSFEGLTGVPMLLNTSFNENEPIVLTPQQALDCFLRTQMDVIVMGRHALERAVVAT